VVTHEHSDHIQSAHTLSHRRKIPIFTTERTFEAKLATKRWHDFQIVRTGCSFQLGSMTFHPVSTPHDAADPFGLRIECQHASLAWISDLGYVTPLVKEALKGCDVVAFEANHDLAMLQNGPYPWETKQRIASRLGHLSNDDSLAALEEVLDERVGQVILTHLSETNNHASLLELRARQCFKQMGLTSLHLCLARQETPLSPLFISPKRLSDEGMSR
jgi:phosphoribosyl 1,2-cyclic phosphodiesterase